MARAYVGGHKNLDIKRWVWDEKDQLFCHKNQLATSTWYICATKGFDPTNPPSFLFIFIFSTESLSVDMAYAYN